MHCTNWYARTTMQVRRLQSCSSTYSLSSSAVHYPMAFTSLLQRSFHPMCPQKLEWESSNRLWWLPLWGALGGALGVFALIYHLGLRYLASPLCQFIVGLPGIRLISYVHWKYWLPSALSFRPRPRFFHPKRLIIRQSNLSHHLLNFYFLNHFLHRC